MINKMYNDLQIIGLDQNNNWVLGLISLTFDHGHKTFHAKYSEYYHASTTSYYYQEFKGSVKTGISNLILEGFGEYYPYSGLAIKGEFIISCRKKFVKDLRSITLKEDKQTIIE